MFSFTFSFEAKSCFGSRTGLRSEGACVADPLAGEMRECSGDPRGLQPGVSSLQSCCSGTRGFYATSCYRGLGGDANQSLQLSGWALNVPGTMLPWVPNFNPQEAQGLCS